MSNVQSNFRNMTFTLLVVCGISAISLSGVYSFTKDKIAQVQHEKKQRALQQVLPVFDSIHTIAYLPDKDPDSLVFHLAFANGKQVGTAIESYTTQGFSGLFSIMVGLLPDQSILNSVVITHKETPGLGDKIEKKKSVNPTTGRSWSDQFNTRNPAAFDLRVKKDGGDVDAITAATISSRAYSNAIDRAHKNYLIIMKESAQ